MEHVCSLECSLQSGGTAIAKHSRKTLLEAGKDFANQNLIQSTGATGLHLECSQGVALCSALHPDHTWNASNRPHDT